MEKLSKSQFPLWGKILSIFLICFIPLNILSVSIGNISRDILKTNILQTYKNQNQYFSKTLQTELQRIVSMQYMLSIRWDISRLALLTEDYTPYEKWSTTQDIENILWFIQSGSEYIQQVDMYIPTMDLTISTMDTTSAQSIDFLLKNPNNYPHDRMFFHDGELLLLTTSAFSNFDHANNETSIPTFSIVTAISGNTINRAFQTLNETSENSGNAFLYNKDWTSSQNNNEIPIAILNTLEENANKLSASSYDSFEVRDGKKIYTVSYSPLNYTDFLLVNYFEESRMFTPITRIQQLIFLLVFLSFFALLLFNASIQNSVKKPLNILIKAFLSVKDGDYQTYIPHEKKDEFGSIYKEFNNMLFQLNRSIDEQFKQTILVQKAQLKQLQSQIEPHFLYNSFFILNRRIRAEDTEGALAFSQNLGEFFRYVIHTGNETVTLSEEAKHAYNYCHIQQLRFRNRVRLSLEDVPESCKNLHMPFLILQPICENVFEHFIEKTRTDVMLQISYRQGENYLDVLIEENNTGLSDAEIERIEILLDTQDSLDVVSGITNIHKRLQLFFSKESGIFPSRSKLGGLCMRLHMETGAMKGSDLASDTIDAV